MKNFVRWGGIVAFVVALVVLERKFEKAPQRRAELGARGEVTARGDGTSLFVDDYRAAAALIGAGKHGDAEKIYFRLADKEPNSPDALVGLAACAMNRRAIRDARTLYEKALGIAPKSVNALIGLGSIHSEESNLDRAAAEYEKALAVDETCPEAHWGLAAVYARSGALDRARLHLERFKQLAPDSQYIAGLEALLKQSASTRP